ncbi:MAG: hypothetical protein E1N59_1933 [Puniceicoccaceae bacterium 5H]|nr:MAG: hypothetical protein E1N59_1933 [Puniceicoccaceae bacterium 5H]
MEKVTHQWLPWLAVAAIATPLHAQENAKVTQDLIQQWVSTEKRISSEVNEWDLEKEILQDSIKALKEEKESLQSAIQEAEESAGEAEKQRAELVEEKEKLQETSGKIADKVAAYEKQLIALSPRLPKPLQRMIKTPLSRIPQSEEDAEDVSLSVRTQNVVAILNEIDKFNGVVTKETDVQELDDGSTAEVTTLYFGLGGAFFTDPEGAYAGVGKPGPDGWTWTVKPDAAEQITRLVAVYDRSVEADYVSVPYEIID